METQTHVVVLKIWLIIRKELGIPEVKNEET